MGINLPGGRCGADDVKKTIKAGKKGNPFAGKQAMPFAKKAKATKKGVDKAKNLLEKI